MCPYCDFAVATGAPDHERYLEAILAELDSRGARFSPAGGGRGNGETCALVSIYLGGGTPSLWRPDCISRAIAAIRSRFGGDALREVTIEANPTDCTAQACADWRAAGVTRVSIGVQSLAADELVVLGRDHRFGDGPTALQTVLAAGLTSSCDAIVGTPGLAPDLGTVDTLARSAVDHLSVYELTIEDRTAFGARVKAGRMTPLDEDVLAELYIAVDAHLTAAGFEHYEISSYARPGKRAIHNSLYWQCAPFLGLGVGAASLELSPDGGGVRQTNPRRVADYYAGVAPERVVSSPSELAGERAWLGMRTSDGVAEEALSAAVTDWLLGEGLATRTAGRICPTLRGFLLANRIAARIAEAL